MTNVLAPRTLTLREGAALAQAIFESYDWRFSLTPEGELCVIVGDDTPTMSQPQIFELIWALEAEFKQLLNVDTMRPH